MLVPRVNWMRRLTTELRELGPYAALGLVLPGGSVILASLWAFRHRRWFLAHAHRTLIIVLTVGAGAVVRGRTLPPSLQSAGGCEPHDDASQSGKGNVMKRNKELIPAWVVDYDAARAQAIRWLGDRYLLARPINRRPDDWGTLPAALRSLPVDVSDAPAFSGEH
jgi:hypothetical protein